MTNQWYNFWNNISNKLIELNSNFKYHDIQHHGRSVLYQINARKNHRICEFGCGDGELLNFVSLGVKQTFGIDYSKIINCKSRNSKIIISDILESGISDNVMDACYCTSLTNYLCLDETIAMIYEMYRITRDRGYVLISDICDCEYDDVINMKIRNLNCPKIFCHDRNVLNKIVSALKPSELYIYDTNIGDYHNNGLSFSILIRK